MALTFEQVIAGAPPTGGDSGSEVARKINDNFSKVNTELTTLSTNITTLLPTGMVIELTYGIIPAGFLECNGAAISRTTYASLYAKIGTTYGIGDNSTTFNIPDLRGQFVRGYDNGRGVDSGRTLGSTQAGTAASSDANCYNGNMTSPSKAFPYGAGAAVYPVPTNVALVFCIKY